MAGRVGDYFNVSPEVASRTTDYKVEASATQAGKASLATEAIASMASVVVDSLIAQPTRPTAFTEAIAKVPVEKFPSYVRYAKEEGMALEEYREQLTVERNTVSSESLGPKFDSGKPRWSLLPSGTIIEVIKVLEFGAQKYSRESWKQVPDGRTRYYDATMRHLEAWFSGEKADKETGISHLAHAMCNLLFLLWKDKNEQST